MGKKKLDFNISSRCGNEYSYHSSLWRIGLALLEWHRRVSIQMRLIQALNNFPIYIYIAVMVELLSSGLHHHHPPLPPSSTLSEWVNQSSVLFGWFNECDNKLCYCFAIFRAEFTQQQQQQQQHALAAELNYWALGCLNQDLQYIIIIIHFVGPESVTMDHIANQIYFRL